MSVSPARVMLVDDHQMLRQALRKMIELEQGVEVVADVGDAQAALDTGMEKRPEILVIDIDMPGLSCFDAVKRLLTAIPNLRVIFLSAFFHDRYIEQALAVSASGYVTKRENLATIVDAIHTVARGELYYSQEVWSRLVIDADKIRLASPRLGKVALLTQRELEVIRYMAAGMSRKEAAGTMHLSIKTVARHIENIMLKLDIHDRLNMVRFAIDEGLAE